MYVHSLWLPAGWRLGINWQNTSSNELTSEDNHLGPRLTKVSIGRSDQPLHHTRYMWRHNSRSSFILIQLNYHKPHFIRPHFLSFVSIIYKQKPTHQHTNPDNACFLGNRQCPHHHFTTPSRLGPALSAQLIHKTPRLFHREIAQSTSDAGIRIKFVE